MKKIYKSILIVIVTCSCLFCKAQVYKAPQDTAATKRYPNESLTTFSVKTQMLENDSRLLDIASRASIILKDTSKYDRKQGLPLIKIFNNDDLTYVKDQGTNGIIALFHLINQNLPKGELISFKTDDIETIIDANNPLELKNLKATIAERPASIGEPLWKSNIYTAYLARDYGTKLSNTITQTTAITEIRQNKNLELIDYDGKPVTLGSISARNKTEKDAVLDFRNHTFPNSRISLANANENYKRALFALISAQENYINSNALEEKLTADLTLDLSKGKESNTIIALKESLFFTANVPGSDGPVLLTENKLINPEEIAANSAEKAKELIILASLHYGQRDATKLLFQLINGYGSTPAQQSGFTAKRVSELAQHGTEQFTSLGFQKNKTDNITNADLILLAVASPDLQPHVIPKSYLTVITKSGDTVINNSSSEEITQINNLNIFSPRISLSSRHTEYRTVNDPLGYVPDGSKISQNGVELRLETDLFFSGLDSVNKRGIKPIIYPEFGVVYGIGSREVGYQNSEYTGAFGQVPRFNTLYKNWGAHLGLNIGPVLIGADATLINTPVASTPDQRYFDLSQGMTYYRYELLTHVLYLKLKKDLHFTIDLDLVAESNNIGFGDNTDEGTDAQIKSGQWYRDYNQVHPSGIFDKTLATDLLNNGDVKSSYASSNYAAIDLGLQKNNFKLSLTGGLYNIDTKDGNEIYNTHIVSNTLKGDLFGTFGITYYFNRKSYKTVHSRKTSSQSANQSNLQEASSSSETKISGPRNHYIFVSDK
ncbi:hypothetical protein [Mucilaginibacter sp.]